MPLTDAQIRNAKPAEKPFKLSDGGWLFLVVAPAGSKLWRMAYRFHGVEKTLSFGGYPDVSLKDARARRDEAKALLAQGIDPSQQRKLDKLSRAVSMATTFGGIAEEYLDKQRRDGRSDKTIEKGRWLLALARPALWDRPIAEIKAPEILAVLKKLEAKGNLESAKRVRGICGSVFRYAIATSRAENDPTQGLRGAISVGKPKHRAAILDPAALGGLLRALDCYDGQPVTKAALKLLPLVFTRPGELRLAEWREFDLEAAVWTIPAARTKMRREHKVPLAPHAVAILRDLHALTGAGRLAFPSLRSTQRPLSENTLNACYRRLGYGKEEVTSHRFRATASTLLNESGRFSADAIERALAHQDPDPVRRAYHRSAYWTERVEMAVWWADYLDRLKTSADVISISARTHSRQA
jgi:integrase